MTLSRLSHTLSHTLSHENPCVAWFLRVWDRVDRLYYKRLQQYSLYKYIGNTVHSVHSVPWGPRYGAAPSASGESEDMICSARCVSAASPSGSNLKNRMAEASAESVINPRTADA